jgi:PTS system ascorbate-specific IIA component
MAVRIVIVAHAPLASALGATALHAFPECAHDVVAVDIAPGTTLEGARLQLRAVLQAAGAQPTLLLVDVAGATPGNAVQEELPFAPCARAVAGANVAMLWRSLCYRQDNLDELVSRCLEGAQRGIQALAARPAPLAT